MAIDPARLYSALLNTGLQSKDNPLYQVIYQLIGAVVKLNAPTGGSSGGGGGSTIINQNTIVQMITEMGDGAFDGNYDGPVISSSSAVSGDFFPSALGHSSL